MASIGDSRSTPTTSSGAPAKTYAEPSKAVQAFEDSLKRKASGGAGRQAKRTITAGDDHGAGRRISQAARVEIDTRAPAQPSAALTRKVAGFVAELQTGDQTVPKETVQQLMSAYRHEETRQRQPLSDRRVRQQ